MVFIESGIHVFPDKVQTGLPSPLWLAEQAYHLAVRARLWAYEQGLLKTHRVPVPVISVGNLTVGGTGKTPVVIALAHYLEQQGKTVAVLSRGYKRIRRTRFHEANHPDYGDEPFLIQQKLSQGKVFVGSDRVYTARKALEICQPDLILLDDGFQHLRLHRDVNILLIDAHEGLGNAHLLPVGSLREPLSSLKRADWILLTEKTPSPTGLLEAYRRQLAPYLDEHLVQPCPFQSDTLWVPETGKTISFENLQATALLLLSGIAKPKRFEAMLKEKTLLPIHHHFIFPDHAVYTAVSLQPVWEMLQAHPGRLLVTTEKDWVKLVRFLPEPLKSHCRVLHLEPVFSWARLLDL